MDLIVERVDVWAASIQDQPGGLSGVLAGLRGAGADLDFIVARKSPERPGSGVVFVTPLRGDRETTAAANLGFNVSNSLHSLRVEGDNKPGICAELTEKIAKARINLRGLSAAVLGRRFIVYIALDTQEDASKAAEVLQKA
jgi:hypothetical protein